MSRLQALVLATFALLASASDATPKAAFIPFQFEDSRVYVPVRIAGEPTRWFILDSGAGSIVIDSEVARASGLKPTKSEAITGAGAGSSQQAKAAPLALSVGGVPLRAAEPIVIDLGGLLGPTSGRRPAGIIGAQFFAEHFVDVDFVRHRLTLYPPMTQRRSFYASAVPLSFYGGLPLAGVVLKMPGGREVTAKALVDLGAKSTFLVPEPFIEREKLREAFPHAVESLLGAGLGGDTYYDFARSARLRFSGSSLAVDQPVVGLSVRGTLRSTWNDGLLGADFLSRFRVAFDYGHDRLLLTQRSAIPAPFDRSGLFLVASGSDLSQIVVRSILANSPAARSGLMPGDEIVAVDGTPARAMSLSAIRDRLKRGGAVGVRLSYRRAGEERRVRFQLRDLI
jgi:hypothetical protein